MSSSARYWPRLARRLKPEAVESTQLEFTGDSAAQARDYEGRPFRPATLCCCSDLGLLHPSLLMGSWIPRHGRSLSRAYGSQHSRFVSLPTYSTGARCGDPYSTARTVDRGRDEHSPIPSAVGAVVPSAHKCRRGSRAHSDSDELQRSWVQPGRFGFCRVDSK